MKALTSPNKDTPLAWLELSDLPLRPDQVRIEVQAAGVNPVDWKMRQGDFLGLVQRVIGPRGPLVVGVDVAGVVREVGAAVTDLAPGDRVVAGTDFSKGERGSYAAMAQVLAQNCCKLPDSVPFDVAGALPVAGVTAQMALFEVAKLQPGTPAKVLVLGASGGVGHMAVQLARNAGFAVVGVCSTRNAALVARLGAQVLDYAKVDVAAEAAKLGPFDLVVNAVGSASYPTAMTKKLLAKGGTLVLVVPGAADLLDMLLPGPVRTVLARPNRARLAPLVEAIAAGKLEVVIDQRIPLAEAERAHQFSQGGKVVGKLVLVA